MHGLVRLTTKAVPRLSSPGSFERLQRLSSNIAEEEPVFQPAHLTHSLPQHSLFQCKRMFAKHVNIEYQRWQPFTSSNRLRLNCLHQIHDVWMPRYCKTIMM